MKFMKVSAKGKGRIFHSLRMDVKEFASRIHEVHPLGSELMMQRGLESYRVLTEDQRMNVKSEWD